MLYELKISAIPDATKSERNRLQEWRFYRILEYLLPGFLYDAFYGMFPPSHSGNVKMMILLQIANAQLGGKGAGNYDSMYDDLYGRIQEEDKRMLDLKTRLGWVKKQET